jgi:hypothetical protein
VSLFRKPEPPIAPSTAMAVAATPSHAPKASEIEGQVRAAVWGHLSPELGRVVGLTVPELLEWVSGARRLAPPDVMALARKIGVVDTPETGVDAIRGKLNAMMRKRVDFGWLDWSVGGRDADNLRDFMAGADCLTLPELNRLARELYGKHVSLDPVTAMLRSEGPAATAMGSGPGPYVPRADAYPPVVSGQEPLHLYPRDPDAENKPARLQAAGWS